MITLFFFGPVVESALGPLAMLGLYLASELGATLLSLVSHYHDPTYRSLGASGAISGVLFAAIVLQPTMGVYVFFIPVAIPAPLFAVAYVAYSYFGARHRLGNIGHDAHLGGAVTGFLLAGWLAPDGYQRIYAAIQHLLH
jgi:membrane associated rhomboid family serine protease